MSKISYRLHSIFALLAIMLTIAASSNIYAMLDTTSTNTLVLLPCGSNINFGETLQCSFSIPTEIDTFIFSANANDKVFIRLTRITGTIVPEFDVAKEGSTSFVCGGISQATCSIPSSGNYVISANERNGINTGDYNIFAQRLNNPGNADSINFGITYQHSLLINSQIDTSTFMADANDVIAVRMVRSTGIIQSSIDVYSPSGAFVCGGIGNTIAKTTCNIPSKGTYTILTQDNNGQTSSSYYLYLQRLNNPENAITLSYSQSKNGSFNYPHQVEAFAFFAKANAKALIRMQRLSGDISTRFSVYDPRGESTCGGSGSSMAQATCTFPYEGTYTIITEDLSGDGIGSYSLRLECQISVCGAVISVYLPAIVK